MSSVSAIRSGIATTIGAALPSVQASDTIDSLNDFPGIYVAPDTSDFEMTNARGTDEWMFNIYIVVSRSDEATGQNTLDSFISGAGSNSIRQILFNSDVGLSDTTVFVTGMKGYGAHFKVNGIPVVGAILTAKAFTSGTV